MRVETQEYIRINIQNEVTKAAAGGAYETVVLHWQLPDWLEEEMKADGFVFDKADLKQGGLKVRISWEAK